MAASLLMSKIVKLADARRNVQAQDSQQVRVERPELRREYRRTSSERLFAQVVKSDDQDMVGVTLSCHAADVSAHGLRIVSSSPVPAGSALDLWVDDTRKPGKFFLSSDVRWVGEDEGGSYHLGVTVHDGAATDFEAWRNSQA